MLIHESSGLVKASSGIASLFEVFKIPYMLTLTVFSWAYSPCVMILGPIYTHAARLIMLGSPLVPCVMAAIRCSKIHPPVIKPITIDMVNLLWNLSGHIKKGESMAFKKDIVDHHLPIGFFAGLAKGPAISIRSCLFLGVKPGKISSFRVIEDKFFKLILSHHEYLCDKIGHGRKHALYYGGTQ